MKKVLFVVAVATLFFSCQKEIEPTTPSGERFTINASIEDLTTPTKADISSSNQLVWAKGDKIGLYVPGWGENQPFTLVGNGGSTNGTFTWDNQTETNTFATNAAAAFFPWGGVGSDKNNVASDGVMYFKLPKAYWSYESGNMLTPLVAKMENSSDPISFKHAGAAVKVTINNLPAHVHSMGIKVNGQQLYGDYHIDPANLGNGLVLDGQADASKNEVWLNVWNGSEKAFTFVFPVPNLTTPKFTFEIYDENDILVWSKTPKTQSSIGRGQILVMPPLTITPYSQFTESENWTFCGTINGSAWINDVPMVSDGNICILSGFTFRVGDHFKIRKDGKWASEGGEEYPSSDWTFTAENAGAKDIFFDINSKTISVIDAKCPYPSVELPVSNSITIDGDMSDWATVQGVTSGNHTLKVFSDSDNIYFYSLRTTSGRYSEIWGGAGYVYFSLDLDNDSSTGGGDIYGNTAEFLMLAYPYDTAPNTFFETPQSNWQCSPSTYSIANVALKGLGSATDGAAIELSIPRADIPDIPNTPITIKSFGNKDMSTVSISRTL